MVGRTLTAAFVATLALGASAAPAHSDGGAKIPLTKKGDLLARDGTLDRAKLVRHIDLVKGKYAQMMANYEKNTGMPHPSRIATNGPSKRAGTGSVPLSDQQGELLWTGSTTVGSNTQQVTVDFDTGSSDTFFQPNVYNPSSSSDSKDTSQTFQVQYGDGSQASGEVYTDDFAVGGLTAKNQEVGDAKSSTLTGPDQGLSGMAWPSLSTFPSKKPFFNTLMDQKTVSQGVFGFKLAKSGSALNLGGVDSSAYSGSITYSPVDTSQGFWWTSASVNGQKINAILDTGTTVIVAPTAQAQQLFSSLNIQTQSDQGSTYGTFDCSNPPKVTFTFSGTDFTLSPDTTSYGGSQNGQCQTSVQGADTGINAWILGDSFLQNVYAIFDFDQSRVGLAKQA